MKATISIVLIALMIISCKEEPKKLRDYSISIINSPLGKDTIKKKIPKFEFTNQMGHKVTNETFKDHIYITDFFFTSCPGICPVMTKNMLKVYDKYNKDILFLSHSIDPRHDDVEKLNKYANKIGIKDDKVWNFVTGSKEDIALMAKNYMIMAYEDSIVAGGFEHGGQFVLIDKKQHVRGYYDGTNDEDVEKLMSDIEILMKE